MTKSHQTRSRILGIAYNLIYASGYQTTSIDEIISAAALTKGAFYYHFGNKDKMGLAVIDELLYPAMQEAFIFPLKNSERPVKDIYKVMKAALLENSLFTVNGGCPLSNIIQEMSSLNNDFNIALARLVDKWQKALKESVKNGKRAGRIRTEVNEEQVAYFIISGYWGIRNFAKLEKSGDCFVVYLNELKKYLKELQ